MKIQTALALSLLAGWGLSTAACGSSTTPIGTGGVPGTGGIVASGGTNVGSGGIVGSGGDVGSGGTASGGDTATGGTCPVAALTVYSTEDTTDANWDDNDFDEATVGTACPVLVDVTWPHEAGYETEAGEDADPADANLEDNVRFSLDHDNPGDLTGKQVTLTITLTGDVRGPAALAGSYLVKIVALSTYEVPAEGSGGAGSGGAGSGGASSGGASSGGASSGGASSGGASSGGASSGGASSGGAGSGGDGSGGDGSGGAPATTTSYTEITNPEAEWGVLEVIGDTATITFAFPAKGTENNSFDPVTAVKVSIRIVAAWTDIGAPPPTYDYLTSQFEISSFVISDVGATP